MNNKENKQIEDLLKQALGKESLESPKSDFMDKLMTTVRVQETTKTTLYEPIISKKGWLLIVGLIVTAFVSSSFLPSNNYNALFEKINLNFAFLLSVKNIIYSDVFVYSILTISVLFLIEVWFLTREDKEKLVNNF
jgi:hypothetical protein